MIFTLTGKEVSTLALAFVVLDALNIVVYFTSLKGVIEHHSKFNGTYSYLYNGKYYKFDR